MKPIEAIDGADRAREMARAFDQAFAEPARLGGEELELLLALRVAGDPYAVRLTDVQGLLPPQKIVPLPSPVPELLGLVGLRGGIVPVYSLRALLGAGPSNDPQAQVWMVLADGPLGLGFDGFEGTLRVARAEIAPRLDGVPRAHVGQVVRAGGALRGIISVRSIVEAVRTRLGVNGEKKER